MRGLWMLNFMALILFAELQKPIGSFCTIEELLTEARNLKCKVYDNQAVISEPNRRFKDIYDKLGYTVPKCLGV